MMQREASLQRNFYQTVDGWLDLLLRYVRRPPSTLSPCFTWRIRSALRSAPSFRQV